MHRLTLSLLLGGTVLLAATLTLWSLSTRAVQEETSKEQLSIALSQSGSAIDMMLGAMIDHVDRLASAFMSDDGDNLIGLQGWLNQRNFGGASFLLTDQGSCHPVNSPGAADCRILADALPEWLASDGVLLASPEIVGDRLLAAVIRTVRDPDGTPFAVVGHSFDARIILNSWTALGLPEGSAITILTSEGALWLREPFIADGIGRDVSGGPLHRAVVEANGLPGITSILPINTDGVPRLVAWQPLSALGLTLAAGHSEAHISAIWWDRYGAGVASFTLVGLAAVAATTVASYRIALSNRRRRFAEDRLERFFHNSSDLLGIVDSKGRLIKMNDAWDKVLGWTERDILGRPIGDLIHPDDQEPTADVFSSQETGRVIIGHRNRYRTQDGQFRWIQWNSHMDESGLVFSSGRDVTGEISREFALEQAMGEAVAANQAKSAFLANMSHELRTPLNAILGFTDLMRQETFGALGNTRYRDYVHDIHDAGSILLSTLSDILDLSRIERGASTLQRAPTDIGLLVQETRRLFSFEAENRGIDLRTQMPDPAPLLVETDERAVGQILRNLISNALKFTDAGGQVTVVVRASGSGGFQMTVSDTGIGIPAEELAEVMQPFQQVQHHLTRGESGSGLGLAIANGLTNALGGTLTLESEVGRGTLVTVRFDGGKPPTV